MATKAAAKSAMLIAKENISSWGEPKLSLFISMMAAAAISPMMAGRRAAKISFTIGVTINDGVSTHLFAAILRVGTKKSGCADNTSAGGIALGIKDDGFLFDKGMLKPQYGTLLSAHPDTGVVLSKFKIPYYEDAVKLVCHAHKFFYNVRSIGWDVAISEKGPIIIEGNDNWEITSIQAIYGGKKRQLTELMGNC